MKDLKIYFFIATVLLTIYLVAQYNKPKDIDWTPTLANTDKIPFGTYILYNQLHDIFPNSAITTYREPVYNVISEEGIKNSTYLIICNNAEINKYDYKKLKEYISKGNEAFIAASYFGEGLIKELHVRLASELRSRSATRIGFLSKDLRDRQYDVDLGCSDDYFVTFDTSKAVVLGNNEFGKATFLRFKIGSGALYLNANPGMFTNYSLLHELGAPYASTALSYLQPGKNLVWDEYYTKGREGSESLMRVFLSNDKLRWAFYIAFFSLLVFVLYEMKRRQRIIPVIEPLSNTTVEFANVVGMVYYEQRNNANIAQKQVAYLLEYIRTQFYLKTNAFDEEFIQALTQKSGAKPELVKNLVRQIMQVRNNSRVSDDELINLNQNIEQFYIQSS
jgi:hypothetical protein